MIMKLVNNKERPLWRRAISITALKAQDYIPTPSSNSANLTKKKVLILAQKKCYKQLVKKKQLNFYKSTRTKSSSSDNDKAQEETALKLKDAYKNQEQKGQQKMLYMSLTNLVSIKVTFVLIQIRNL